MNEEHRGRTVACAHSHGRCVALERVHATKVTSPPRTRHTVYHINPQISGDTPTKVDLGVVLASVCQISLIWRPKIPGRPFNSSQET